jgi:hypothetical protein
MSRIVAHQEYEWQYYDTDRNLTFPWYTIGCLEWLTKMDLSELSVFEYGCGRSSIWWKNECKSWTGVDSNPDWANGAKVTVDFHEYTTACTDGKYDIIIIDGIYRDECTEHALKSINPGGYIIIDNWDQATTDMPIEYWHQTANQLKNYQTIIHKEPLHQDWKTAVFHII